MRRNRNKKMSAFRWDLVLGWRKRLRMLERQELERKKMKETKKGKHMRVEQVAELCHEANRVYCRSLGDESQTAWVDAPEWQKQSAVNGVKFHLEHPAATDASSHESWLAEKRAAGWAYGPVKDAAAKTHPCFVPFEALPREQQVKDALFRGIVHAVRDLVA
jgi:hypothetical protein